MVGCLVHRLAEAICFRVMIQPTAWHWIPPVPLQTAVNSPAGRLLIVCVVSLVREGNGQVGETPVVDQVPEARLIPVVCTAYKPTAEISWWTAKWKEIGGGIRHTPEACVCSPEQREYVNDADGLHAKDCPAVKSSHASCLKTLLALLELGLGLNLSTS